MTGANKYLTTKCEIKKLCGEHVYFVFSYLKNIGASKVVLKPIKDINSKSNKYLYEVAEIIIHQDEANAKNDRITKNSEILILYHDKMEIINQYTSSYFRKRNVKEVVAQLKKLGFENIECKKISDVILGVFVKENTVESVLDSDDVPIRKHKYKYDTKIIVNYHAK